MRSYPNNTTATCAYGLPTTNSFFGQRAQCPQLRFAQTRGLSSPDTMKRKHHDDDTDDQPVSSTMHHRVVMDAFGNRVLVDGLKRMRVSSPPTVSPPEDTAMDDSDSDSDTALVPVHKQKMPTLVESAKQAIQRMNAMPSELSVDDPSCRAMVLFDPYQSLVVERSPRIQLVTDNDPEPTSDSETEEPEKPFVRFEELPDDYEDEPEAMEID